MEATHSDGSSESIPVDMPSGNFCGAEADIDPNQDRKKRRKVTSRCTEYTAQENRPSGSHHWLRQLEAAASEGDTAPSRDPVDSSDQDQQNEATLNDNLTVPPADTPAAAILPTTQPQPVSDEPPEETQEADKQTTPKMLKITSSGKLGRSPRRGPKQATPPKPPPSRTSRRTRNLTMKQGRIAQSLKVTLSYNRLTEDPRMLGEKIDGILSQPIGQPAVPVTRRDIEPTEVIRPPPKPQKSLHPFFMGKAANRQQSTQDIAAESGKPAVTGAEPVKDLKPVKAWNDLGFSGSKSSVTKDNGTLSPLWPPLELQRVPPNAPITKSHHVSVLTDVSAKQKRDLVRVPSQESVLDIFSTRLIANLGLSSALCLPQQLHLSGDQLLNKTDSGKAGLGDQTRLEGVRHRIQKGQSAFDRGEAAGPLDWIHEYAPKRAEDVLQQNAVVLKDWLEQLKVHNVQSKLSVRQQKKKPTRKKRVKRRTDGLDDFLVPSDEEDEVAGAPVKNAILICGPHGCGKTASVFAAAHQLDFEVFEIHPGMRRTAKDIFDKVGDMTHNHLVQTTASAPLSRASSVLSDVANRSDDPDTVDPKQKSLGGFFGAKTSKLSNIDHINPAPEKEQQQKQSLILFEEVDVLFEEDKTFWSGVQSLIATSKRPIVLTCSNPDAVNLEEISLQMTLHYENPHIDEVVEHLAYVAAAEGHIIARDALRELYLSRGQDLRAALTELNFWCQMTVGSTMGGLDWMHHGSSNIDTGSTSSSRRIVSRDTFHTGLHLVPEQQLETEDLLAYAQDSLGLSVMDYETLRTIPPQIRPQPPEARLESLRQTDVAADFRSFMDLADDGLNPLLSCRLANTLPARPTQISRQSIAEFLLYRPKEQSLPYGAFFEAFQPIMEDNRTFPPPTGRTAPSLDGAISTVAVEVAPYIRHIVQLDQQLEGQRNEIDAGSQGTGKQRNTRAARAALMGGHVANTRVDRWFPKSLDFEMALATGGRWSGLRDDMVAPSQVPSMSRESTGTTLAMDVD
ncbi:uncharacterized protein HMPREF1541_03836 [Cyphellophora europaea CBS 101466]|uniref:Uncharacterized protein n=1 Tax=Cyphellophora europaea (strain CBS 101466) TaxID=1220924 RepID=W2RZQ5_CYPE1|nr:uncharacterized protein HMPREF1541_03836 [Cyphellophora europaea CBS 101466]ETN41897.1 hypothetical protein HMPREF1541_03836 [Cyphellophora europaea CBS 101466]